MEPDLILKIAWHTIYLVVDTVAAVIIYSDIAAMLYNIPKNGIRDEVSELHAPMILDNMIRLQDKSNQFNLRDNELKAFS